MQSMTHNYVLYLLIPNDFGHLYMYNSIIFLDCTKPAVEEFPSDFLTAEQRENGGIILHFIIGKIFNHLVDIRIRVYTIITPIY